VTSIDIETNLSDEDVAVRDVAHKFAEEVLRPAGVALDRMVDPADVIAPDSILWEVFAKYHALGLGGLAGDTEREPVAKARLMAIVNEELSWGDVGLAISCGLSGFHGPWVQQTGDPGLIERFC
jgi:alkylation response protein AidB-like acyl-CoA dehydrogenase